MPREITITLPDGVADQLEQETNISAYVSKALLTHMLQERTSRKRVDPEVMREVLARMESRSTEEGRARAQRELDEAAAKMTPELREWARQLLAEHAPHRLHQLPQV